MNDIPLYLIPGTMCDERLWQKLMPFLDGFSINFGSYAGKTSMQEMLEAVTEQRPTHSHLIGFSLGGYLALKAALNNPEAFESIIIIASSPYGLSADEKTLRQANADMLTRMTYRGMSRKRLAQFIHARNLTNTSITETILKMERDLGQKELITQLLAPIERESLKEQLAQFSKSVHFIMAEDDQMVPIAAIEKLAANNSHIHLHRLADTGHMIPLEAPTQLAELITSIVGANT